MLPYYLSAIAILYLTGYIFIVKGKELKRKVFGGRANLFLFIFTALTVAVAAVYKNLLGMGVSVLFIFIIFIMNFSAAVCTKDFFIKLLKTIAALSLSLAFSTFAEKIYYLAENSNHRCLSYCMNPNYLAELLMISILASAYLELSRNAHGLYCYIIAAIDLIAMLLTGSMFACVSLLLGIAVMLILMRRRILLSLLLILVSMGLSVLIMMPELLPRFGEIAITTGLRMRIWNTSIDSIRTSFLFGKGFLSYSFVSHQVPDAYVGWHAHNLLLECLISFGVVGTSLISAYFILFFRRFTKVNELLGDRNGVFCFVIALVAAATVHSLVDLTFFWCQTGLLGAILIGGGMSVTYSSLKAKK